MSNQSHRRPASPARDLALITVFAAFIAVLGLPGMITPFGSSVPITVQTLGVMLAGSILGGRRAAAAVALFVAVVALGLPLLAGGRGGLAVFTAPSVGYLLGWIPGAAVIGYLIQQRLPHFGVIWGLVSNIIGGIVVVYACGIPLQAYLTGTDLTAAALSSLIFLPGDMVKVVVATLVAVAVHRAVPDLITGRRTVAAPQRHDVSV